MGNNLSEWPRTFQQVDFVGWLACLKWNGVLIKHRMIKRMASYHSVYLHTYGGGHQGSGILKLYTQNSPGTVYSTSRLCKWTDSRVMIDWEHEIREQIGYILLSSSDKENTACLLTCAHWATHTLALTCWSRSLEIMKKCLFLFFCLFYSLTSQLGI